MAERQINIFTHEVAPPELKRVILTTDQLNCVKKAMIAHDSGKYKVKIECFATHLVSITYTDLQDRPHREDGPAHTGWYPNGNLAVESYWINDVNHRENGPACTKWHPNGKRELESYYYKGRLHREEGAAQTKWYPNCNIKYKEYSLHGQLHKESGPARVWLDKWGTVTREEYWWEGAEVDETFIPPHLRPQPDGLGRTFL